MLLACGDHPALAGVAEEQIDQVGYCQDACGRGYHIFLGTVSQGERATGATGASNPVGSALGTLRDERIGGFFIS